MIKNKRADITIVILVIGVIAVCFLAIFSFYSSDINLKKDFIGIEMIHEINSLSDEIKFYKNSKINKEPSEIMNIFSQDTDEDEKIVFTGRKNTDDGRDVYNIDVTYFEEEKKFFGLIPGEKKRIFYTNYIFVPD